MFWCNILVYICFSVNMFCMHFGYFICFGYFYVSKIFLHFGHYRYFVCFKWILCFGWISYVLGCVVGLKCFQCFCFLLLMFQINVMSIMLWIYHCHVTSVIIFQNTFLCGQVVWINFKCIIFNVRHDGP
jgi:hypothetical protein